MVLVFVIASLVSLGFITVQAWNYNYYWTAHSQLTASLNRVHLDRDPATGNFIVQTSASVTNPTPYNGLTWFLAEVGIYFVNPTSNATIFSEAPILSSVNPMIAVRPGSTVTVTIPSPLSSTQSSTLLNQTGSIGTLHARVLLTVIVDSFLDPVIGRLQRMSLEEIPLS